MASEIMASPNPNDDDNGNDIMKMMQLAATNISGLSQQMGLVNARVDNFGNRLDHMEDAVTKIGQEVTVTRAQRSRLYNAVTDRCCFLLKTSEERDAYLGAFKHKCWGDAQRKSKCGRPYADTLKVDFDEVLGYINAWEPEYYGGIDGYKEHLDTVREEHGKNNA